MLLVLGDGSARAGQGCGVAAYAAAAWLSSEASRPSSEPQSGSEEPVGERDDSMTNACHLQDEQGCRLVITGGARHHCVLGQHRLHCVKVSEGDT